MKGIFKKFWAFILATVCVFSLFTFGCASSKRDLNFELIADGTGYIVTGFKEGKTAEELVIPSTFNDLPVVEIGFNSFVNNKEINSITIPETVKKIGVSAFKGCSNLSTINLSEGLEIIEKTSFAGCGVINLTIPNSTKNIGESAFEECEKLESVTLGSGMERVYDFSFYRCKALVDLDLGTGLKCIRKSAFQECTALTEITIPASVEMIYGWAFYACTSVTKFTFLNTEGWMNSEEYSSANLHMHPNEHLPLLTDPVENVKHFTNDMGQTYCAWRAGQVGKNPQIKSAYVGSVGLLWYTCDTKDKW